MTNFQIMAREYYPDGQVVGRVRWGLSLKPTQPSWVRTLAELGNNFNLPVKKFLYLSQMERESSDCLPSVLSSLVYVSSSVTSPTLSLIAPYLTTIFSVKKLDFYGDECFVGLALLD